MPTKKNEEEKCVIRHCLRAGSHEPLNFVKVEGGKKSDGERCGSFPTENEISSAHSVLSDGRMAL